MKHAFLLTGSNAAGKTTTVAKVLEPWVVSYGNDVVAVDPRIMNIRADNDGRFKGDAQAQRRALTEVWLSDTPILMIEGTRINTPLMDVYKKYKNMNQTLVNPDGTEVEVRELTVILALQKPEIMKKHLMDRCAKKNKVFEAGYWDFKKLEYEGMKRYPNSFRKNGIKSTTFMIDAEYNVCQEIVNLLQTRIREILG